MSELPEYLTKKTLVLGCGNTLFGDDGFGPAVADYLIKNYVIPENALVLDVGTSVRKLLFTILLSDTKPERIIIVDAVDIGRKPGEVFEISLDEVPEEKANDFSLHQPPTSNMLKELDELGEVKVSVVATQVRKIPKEVSPGLTKPVTKAVAEASKIIYDRFIMRQG